MKAKRAGWPTHDEPAKNKRRRYRIHYALKKRGNIVNALNRTVIKRALNLTKTENKYIAELILRGYAIQNPMYHGYSK